MTVFRYDIDGIGKLWRNLKGKWVLAADYEILSARLADLEKSHDLHAKHREIAEARLAEAKQLIQDINAECGFGDLTQELRDRMDAFSTASQPPAARRVDLTDVERFHRRAAKLIRNGEPFFVVKASEPYASKVVDLIRSHEGAKWTDEDEQWAREALGAADNSPEVPCEHQICDARGEPGNLVIYCRDCGVVMRAADSADLVPCPGCGMPFGKHNHGCPINEAAQRGD